MEGLLWRGGHSSFGILHSSLKCEEDVLQGVLLSFLGLWDRWPKEEGTGQPSTHKGLLPFRGCKLGAKASLH